jgi:hypothetical protein
MSELSDLYPALAAVAAITTALHTQIAVGTFNECSGKVRVLATTDHTEAKYGNVARERGSVTVKNGLLNFPATVVNAFVIIAWGYLVYSQPAPADEWLYFLPWFGVAEAALFLFLLVASSLVALWTRRWGPAAWAAGVLGLLATLLLVAGALHAWLF